MPTLFKSLRRDIRQLRKSIKKHGHKGTHKPKKHYSLSKTVKARIRKSFRERKPEPSSKPALKEQLQEQLQESLKEPIESLVASKEPIEHSPPESPPLQFPEIKAMTAGAILTPLSTLNLKISYKGVFVLGQMLSQNQTRTRPTLTLMPKPVNGKYLIVMLDPDVPPKPSRTFTHLVSVYDASLNKMNDVIDDVVPYYPPTPPVGSGIHRYQFSLYNISNLKMSVPTLNEVGGDRIQYSAEILKFLANAGIQRIGGIQQFKCEG